MLKVANKYVRVSRMPTMRLTALYSEPATPGETKSKGDYSKNFTLRELLLQKSAGKGDDDDDDDCVKLPQLNVVRIAVSIVFFSSNFFFYFFFYSPFKASFSNVCCYPAVKIGKKLILKSHNRLETVG